MNRMVNLQARLAYVEKEIVRLNKLISTAPSGKLICRKNGDEGHYRYSRKIKLSDGTTKEIYLGIDQEHEIKLLARKMLAEKELKDLEEERTLLIPLIELQQRETKTEAFLRSHPGIQRKTETIEEELRKKAEAWKKQSYNRNVDRPEGLIYPTVLPELMVRSKSEADIVSRLEYYGVPYHYEENIQTGSYVQAIDFVCMNISKDQIWYWDHRGMMDNLNYLNKIQWCEKQMWEAGIIQGKNLIVTTETKSNPLDLHWVDELIQFYLM